MLRIIHRPRAAGKTHEAVELANQTGAHLVVRDRSEVERIVKFYQPMFKPITFEDLEGKDSLKRYFTKNIIIDNGDDWLEWHFTQKGIKLDAITVSVVDSKKPEVK